MFATMLTRSLGVVILGPGRSKFGPLMSWEMSITLWPAGRRIIYCDDWAHLMVGSWCLLERNLVSLHTISVIGEPHQGQAENQRKLHDPRPDRAAVLVDHFVDKTGSQWEPSPCFAAAVPANLPQVCAWSLVDSFNCPVSRGFKQLATSEASKNCQQQRMKQSKYYVKNSIALSCMYGVTMLPSL